MSEDIMLRPLSAEEQKRLLIRSENALIALKTWEKCMAKDRKEGDEEEPIEVMLQSAIEIFTELRRQWAISIGNPVEIRGATLKKILDASLRILREEICKGTL